MREKVKANDMYRISCIQRSVLLFSGAVVNLPWPEVALQERLTDGHNALGKSTCRATSLNSSGAVCAPTVKTAEAVLPAAAAVAGQGDAITNASAGRGAEGACEHTDIKW